MLRGRLIAVALVAAGLTGLTAPGAGAQSCPDEGEVGYVCGVNNAEDLLRVEGTPFVLTGNMGNPDGEAGGFYAIDTRTRAVRDVEPSFTGPAQPAYRACPGPPDPAKFTAHGIDLVKGTVHAVNHGGRESIEVFRLEASASGLALTWLGCALIPEGHDANSVAAMPDGGFVATVPLKGEQELFNAGSGQPTGAVLRWSPATGWRELPEAKLSFPNGILVSPDGATLFVAGYTEQTVARLSAETGAIAAKVKVPFNPDNLRRAPDGAILATGQNEQPAVVQVTCVSNPSLATCPVPTSIGLIDPATLEATTIFEREGNDRFGAGTSAIVVGDELWLGSFRAQRLLRVPRRILTAPVASEGQPASGRPRFRLVRRCVRGNLRVELRGDVDRVRDVTFKFGRRLIDRDTSAPFRRVLARRALRATKARRLRAVIHHRDGRAIRARTLPRCGT